MDENILSFSEPPRVPRKASKGDIPRKEKKVYCKKYCPLVSSSAGYKSVLIGKLQAAAATLLTSPVYLIEIDHSPNKLTGKQVPNVLCSLSDVRVPPSLTQ